VRVYVPPVVESATMYKCGQVQSAQEYIMYLETVALHLPGVIGIMSKTSCPRKQVHRPSLQQCSSKGYHLNMSEFIILISVIPRKNKHIFFKLAQETQYKTFRAKCKMSYEARLLIIVQWSRNVK